MGRLPKDQRGILKVALYARVSTKDKDQDPETQLFALRSFCERMGHDIVAVYSEKAHAQNLKQRTEWRELMARCMMTPRRRGFDAVLVYKIDRAWRDSFQMRQDLNAWEVVGVAFISSTQDIDTSTAMGKFFLHLLGLIAEMELETIRERVKTGIDKARADGKIIGRRPNNSRAMRLAVQAVRDGMSQASASVAYDVPKSTLNRKVKVFES